MRESIQLEDTQGISQEIDRSNSLCEAICKGLQFLNSKLRADGLTIGRKEINGVEIDCYRTQELTRSGIVKDPDSDTWIVSRSIRLFHFEPLTISALYHMESTRDEEAVLSRVCEQLAIASRHLPATSNFLDCRKRPLSNYERCTLPFHVVRKSTREEDIANLLGLKMEDANPARRVILPITAGMD